MDEFAGRTPTGTKVHRAWGRHTTACWQYISNRPMYMAKVSGPVKKDDLCRKCWGDSPTTEYLAKFGLVIK